MTKKVFETYWTEEAVLVDTKIMPHSRAAFFDIFKENNKLILSSAMIPEIPFRELMSLAGKKTRVTIEILP